MRNGILILLISICASSAAAQSDSTHADTIGVGSYAIYAEWGGPALYYSFNFDQVVFTSMSYRAGFALVEGSDKHWALLLPVFLNWFPVVNSRSTSKLEIDAGLVYHSSGVSIWYETIAGSGTYFSLGAGYRYQSADDGIIFRITFTPLFFSDQLFPFGGVSLGWAF